MTGDVDPPETFPEHGSPEDLEQRLRLMPLGDTVRGFVFSSLLESVRQEAEPEALRRCLAVVEETHFLAFFNYPAHALLKLSFTAGHALSAKYGGFDGAMRRLGSRAVPDFYQSTVGRLMRNVAGMDARRLLGWVPVIYPTLYHHGRFKLSWLGDTSGQIVLSGGLYSPPFIEASIAQMLAPFELEGLSMRVRRVSPLDAELSFSWTERTT